jgi:hypothetical protein
MSTHQIGVLSSFPRSDLFVTKKAHFNTLKYSVNRVLSCWHLQMSRPFTQGRESYRSCLRCGMRRPFDLQTWKATGYFYSPSLERRPPR